MGRASCGTGSEAPKMSFTAPMIKPLYLKTPSRDRLMMADDHKKNLALGVPR